LSSQNREKTKRHGNYNIKVAKSLKLIEQKIICKQASPVGV
jgi:hypothetical protein